MDADLAADFALLGVEIDQTDIETTDDHAFGIWKYNWESWRVFLACDTQWRGGPSMMGMIWTGIDYCAADVVMRRFSSPDAVFDDLRHMEAEALQAFSEVTR